MKNKVPGNILNKDKWKTLKRIVNDIVDHYVVTHEIDQVSQHHPLQLSAESNPHQAQIQSEHSYASPYELHSNRIIVEHNYIYDGQPSIKKRRVLPTSIAYNQPSISSRQTAPDGAFEYACTA